MINVALDTILQLLLWNLDLLQNFIKLIILAFYILCQKYNFSICVV